MIDKKILHVVNISFVLPYYIGDQFEYSTLKGVKFYVACQASQHLRDFCYAKKIVSLELNILREISIINDIAAIIKLVKYIKSEEIDIIVAHTPKGGLIGMSAAYLAGVKKRIYFRHGLMFETSTGLKRFILKTAERLTGFLATQVVCVSPSVLEISNQQHLSSKEKNVILNKGTCNGIDALNKFNKSKVNDELVRNLKERYDISSKDRVIGFVGRLVNDKGINELLSAWKQLTKNTLNVKLLLIGPVEARDTISSELLAYITNTPNIIYTGMIDDLAPYYCLMDIFILPSHREGFPTVVLEASAMELPVLTTRATGCRDSIIDNETGFFIDLTPTDIVDKLNRYLENNSLAKKHGEYGRNFIIANFNQQRIWEEINSKIFGI